MVQQRGTVRENQDTAERNTSLRYEYVDWVNLGNGGNIKSQRVFLLNLYIKKHQLIDPQRKLTKPQKVELVSAHVRMSADLSQAMT